MVAMRLALLSSSAISFALGAVSGIPESDFYPLVEYWKAGDFRANPLCEGENAPEPRFKAEKYPARTSVGLKAFSEALLATYRNEIRGLSIRDMLYSANQRRRSTSWNSVVSNALKATIASARTTGGNPHFQEAFCSNYANNFPVEDFCYAEGNWTKAAKCMSNYEYEKPAEVLQVLDPQQRMGSWIPHANDPCLNSVSPGRDPLDLALQQFVSTPGIIDTATANSENKVYYLLYKAVDYVKRYGEYKYLTALDQMAAREKQGASSSTHRTPAQPRRDIGIHDLFKDGQLDPQILPEWKIIRIFTINEPRFKGGPTLRTPYAVLAARGLDLLVVLRPPQSTYEDRLAMYTQQSFKYLYNFTGEVHDGSATVYQTLAGVLEFAMDNFYEGRMNEVRGKMVRVTFAGSELPSNGASVILASQMQRVLSEKFAHSDVMLQVGAVVFGETRMADETFVNRVKRSIEIRHVVLQGDSAALFPCPLTVSCDERVLLPRTGIETGIEYNYAALPGRVVIGMDKLARLHDAWGDESTVLQLAAIKDCAYPCYLSSAACPSDPDINLCDPEFCESFVQA